MRHELPLLVLGLALAPLASGCGESGMPTAPTAVAPPPAASVPMFPGNDAIPAVHISVGEVVRASISPADPICDPRGWDARAPCKRFLLDAVSDGVLTAILLPDLTSVTSDVIDILLTAPGGASAYCGGGEEQRVSMPVVAGRTYEIRINSYPYLMPAPGDIVFELRTEM